MNSQQQCIPEINNLEVANHLIQLFYVPAIDLSLLSGQNLGSASIDNMVMEVNQAQNFKDFLNELDDILQPTINHKNILQKTLNRKKNLQCSICQAKLIRNKKMPKLACKHIFHMKCLEKWLEVNDSCPLCRQAILNK